MKFLDTSFLVDYLKGRDYTIEYLEENSDEAFYASTLSFFELARGELKSDAETDLQELKEDLEWLNQKNLDQEAAEEAARIEEKLVEKGEKVNLADVLIAGTAANTGSEIVSGDSDFSKIPELEVFNPRK